MRHRILTIGVALATLLTATPVAAGATPRGPRPDPGPAEVTILTISDWHGQLDPVGGVGGAAVLSAYVARERQAAPGALLLTAGDAFGGTPPLSAYFEDVPAVQAMNLMGFDADTLGNHNFDRGTEHLQRMVGIATFPFVSANLRGVDANVPGIAPYVILDRMGVKVAVIGVTNPEAPTLVFPGNFGTIEVTDPVPAAMKARAAAKKEGAELFVLLAHMGVTGTDPVTGQRTGPLIDLANAVGGFDLIVGDHTNDEFSGIVNGMRVVENRSKGATYARVRLSFDTRARKVLSSTVDFVTPRASGVTPDPAIEQLLAPYRAQLGPILSETVGTSTVAIPRSDACGRADSRLCESRLGNVVTDAMRTTYGTDFALTNAGGLRADLTCPQVDDPTDFCPAYLSVERPITRGQVLAVLPFGNVVSTLTVSGAEVKAMLEHGVSRMPDANGRFPQVSGLCFTYDVAASVGSRVVGAWRQAADGSCSGAPIDLTAASSYSLAINDFIASGGDSYPVVVGRTVTRDFMHDVVASYVTARSPLNPAIQGRITCVSTGTVACPAVLPTP